MKSSWAVYKDWCQEKPFIWTVYPNAKGCMRPSILKNVLGIVYLGHEESGAFISTKRNKLILTSESLQKRKNQTMPILWDIQELELDILTWGNDLFSAKENSAEGLYQKCLLKGRHTYSAGYNFPLKLQSNVRLDIDKESCTSNKHYRWDSFELLPQHLDSGIVIGSIEDPEFHCTSKAERFNQRIRSKTFKRNIESQNFMVYTRSKDLLTVANSEKINEQTERLARKLIAHIFLEEPLPDMSFVEWKFLLMAEDIFDIACPNVMVPKEFFESILIFYRFLLLESFDKFPPKIEKDGETRVRIEENLKKCLVGAKVINFKGYNNCSTGSEALIAEYEHTNGTIEEVIIQIPDRVKIDIKNFDLLLESTWKLMIFVHYYCADYFKNTPQDLSTLLERWQELMAPDILTRWQCAGKSYQMVRTLIRSVDLAKTLKHLDHCVAASHMYSVYPGWVQRPIPIPFSLKGKYINGLPFGGNGINAPMPVSPIKQVGRSFNFYRSAMGSKFPESQWDTITHCMSDYTYPAKVLGYSFDKCGASLSV